MFLARSATPASSVGAGVTLAAVNVADNRGKNKYTTCKEGEDTFCAEHLIKKTGNVTSDESFKEEPPWLVPYVTCSIVVVLCFSRTMRPGASSSHFCNRV